MPRKPKFKDPDDQKLREDTAETAFRTLQEAIGERPKTDPAKPGEKNPEAVKRGSKGGKRGGPARAEKLSPEQRSEVGRAAARARWSQTSSHPPAPQDDSE
jgi:hypothetical protein